MRNPFVILAMSCVIAACSGSPPAEGTKEETCPLDVPAGGTTMLVGQRSTTAIPGSGRGLRLTVGDVTRGQVMTSVASAQGEILVAPASMRVGDETAFWPRGHAYTLRLEHLENRLIGMDTATFRITRGARSGVTMTTEQETIAQLIDHLRSLEGVTFIRNGEEHDGMTAAEHLETKWSFAGMFSPITATQFVQTIGSVSSVTGTPYRVRLADGTEMDAAEFFGRRLEQIRLQR